MSALFGAADQARFEALRRRWFPPERNVIAAHLTLFHHLPPSSAPELKHRLAVVARGPAPAARAVGAMSLGRGVAIRIESPGLAAIRADLAAAFAGLLTPQDQQGWRPHVTIQNKVTPAEAKATLVEVSAEFRSGPVVVAGLAAWWYRGGPWEPLSRHMFA